MRFIFAIFLSVAFLNAAEPTSLTIPQLQTTTSLTDSDFLIAFDQEIVSPKTRKITAQNARAYFAALASGVTFTAPGIFGVTGSGSSSIGLSALNPGGTRLVFFNSATGDLGYLTLDPATLQIVGSTLSVIGGGGGGGGLTSLNGLAGPALSFAIGSGGTTPVVSAAGSTITLNVPDASALNKGYLRPEDFVLFNNKVPTTRSITTAEGITGGGTLASDPSPIKLNFQGLPVVASIDIANDIVAFRDTSDGQHKAILAGDLVGSGVFPANPPTNSVLAYIPGTGRTYVTVGPGLTVWGGTNIVPNLDTNVLVTNEITGKVGFAPGMIMDIDHITNITKIDFQEIPSPTLPASGHAVLYFRNGAFYIKKSDGTDVAIGTGGGAGGYGCINLPPKSWKQYTSLAAGIDSSSASDKVLFDDTLDEFITTEFSLPEDYVSGGRLYGTYSMSGASSGTIRFECFVMAITPGTDTGDVDTDSYDVSNSTGGNVPGTVGDIRFFEIPLTANDGWAAGDYVRLKFQRDGDGTTGSDTAIGDGEVRTLQFRYQK